MGVEVNVGDGVNVGVWVFVGVGVGVGHTPTSVKVDPTAEYIGPVEVLVTTVAYPLKSALAIL